jgi:hypothetical protein
MVSLFYVYVLGASDDLIENLRVQGPSFGSAHMKSLYPVFLDKGHKVRPR